MTAAKSAVPHNLKIPDVGGLSLKDAALAYAQAGMHIVPTRRGAVKNPGSLVGAGWHNQASCDPDQIEKWWSEYPNIGGIAFHPGPSGVVVFDYDKKNLSMPDDVREALQTGKFQQSRQNGIRGHYFFACEPGEFGGSAGRFMRWGEVRSQGGVIILAPSEHPEDDGLYLWHDSGELPPLPDLLREMLSAPGQSAEPKTSEELKTFLAKYTENNEQHGLQGPLTSFHADVKAGGSRHDAMRDALPWAFRESIIGRYSAQFAYESLKFAFRTVKQEAEFTGEFDRLAQWAAAVAELADPDEIRAKVDRPKDQSAELDDSRPATVCLADVEPKRVEWLWKGWLPLGKLSLFEGESDVGKSTVTLSWASIVSTGARWPETVTADGQTMISQHDPAGVVLVGVEDSNADTVVPRLIAAGADLRRVHSLARPVDTEGNAKPFTIPDDINWLRRAIVEADAKLVVIDPISACLPENAKHGVDSSIRRILMSLVDLAEETGAAIVMIRHFNKSAGMSAKNRGGGSVAYTALVRSVLQANQLVMPTENGATHAIALAVGNLSKKLKSLTYTLEDAPRLAALPSPEDDGLGVAVVKYCGTTDLNADQLVGADGAKVSDARKTAPMRDDAEEALREVLENGDPQEMKPTIAKVMDITGCSQATVKNAAKALGILKERHYENGKVKYWTWRLPPSVLSMDADKMKKQLGQ